MTGGGGTTRAAAGRHTGRTGPGQGPTAPSRVRAHAPTLVHKGRGDDDTTARAAARYGRGTDGR